MNYTIQQLCTICNATIVASASANIAIYIAKIGTDTRNLYTPANTIFIALKTKKSNGNKYLIDAYQKGITCFLVEEIPVHIEKYPAAVFIVVKNTWEALHAIATHHRQQYTYPVVSVVGSNGKTIVKEWLFQLLHKDYSIVRSPKSYNSQLGVPLSVLSMEATHQLAIIEAGISRPNEMEALTSIIQPTECIITNIGTSHQENFNTISHKIQEKLVGASTAEVLFYCKDHKNIDEEITKIYPTKKCITWGFDSDSTLHLQDIQIKNQYTSILAIYNHEAIGIDIPYTDKAYIENTLHCINYLLYKGYTEKMIVERLPLLHSVDMRLEIKKGIHNCMLVNDAYSMDSYSLKIALDCLLQQPRTSYTIILSDMEQEENQCLEQNYQQLSQLLQERKIQRLIGIGTTIVQFQHLFESTENHFYESTALFLEQVHHLHFANEAILLKGARKFEFEKISRYLEEKKVVTCLEINLTALASNYNYYKNLLAPTTKVMAMVKALGYGSGSIQIANVLQHMKVDYLGVAYADEGVALRQGAIQTPIMVMNPDKYSLDSILQSNLEPEIYNFTILNDFIDKVHKQAITSAVIHLKIDTGMHRLGFMPSEISALLEILTQHPYIQVASIFSHLVGTDEPDLDDFTRQQINLFTTIANQIESILGYPTIRHILNSVGIERFPEAHLDMVRVGIGMYGISANKALKPISTLKTHISQLKLLPKEATIGYSRKGILYKETQVATLPIGYADGLSRRVGNGKYKVFIKNIPAPFIGNICMDMCMVDVTGIACCEGDEVVLFNEKHPIQDMAKAMETIPYEVIATISARVKRTYYEES